jgi:hypothetical protein
MDLTGKTVLVANASTGDNDTTAANTAFVQQEIAALVDSSPSALNTLNELAAALGDDENFSTTVTDSIATKMPLAGGTFTGDVIIEKSGNPSFTVKTTGAGNNPFLKLQAATNYWEFLGIFSNSDDELDIRYNGSSKLEIDNSGNATFAGTVTAPGTDTQQYRLLQGTAQAGGMFKERTITGSGVSNDLSFFAEGISDGGEIHFMTGGSATIRVTIDSAGRVGIGTDDPYGTLELKGSGNSWFSAPAVRMWDDLNTKGWFAGTANNITAGDFYIRTLPSIGGVPGTNEQEFVIKHATGDVGIGHMSPKSKLSIVGNGQLNTYSGVIGIENTATDKWASIALTDDIGTASASSNYYLIGRGSTYANRYMSFHIPTVSDYGSGSQPKFVFASTGAVELFTVEASTGDAYHKGNVDVAGTLHSPGHVIQTVYNQSASLVVPSQTQNDYTTFIQITITPKFATSKILITGIAGVEVSGGNYPTVHCRLYRDSTHIKSYLYWGYEGAQTTHRILNEPIHYEDSPNTTSSITYYAKLANSSGSSYTGTYSGKAHAYNPSTIMVQEIAQ